MPIKECVTPVLHVANLLQSSKGDIKLKEPAYSDYGVWKSVLCINAETKEIYNEDNCSYTVITVPRQQAIVKKREYKFIFKLNSMETVAVRINELITCIFSGEFLSHKQSCNIHHHIGEDDYVS